MLLSIFSLVNGPTVAIRQIVEQTLQEIDYKDSLISNGSLWPEPPVGFAALGLGTDPLTYSGAGGKISVLKSIRLLLTDSETVIYNDDVIVIKKTFLHAKITLGNAQA